MRSRWAPRDWAAAPPLLDGILSSLPVARLFQTLDNDDQGQDAWMERRHLDQRVEARNHGDWTRVDEHDARLDRGDECWGKSLMPWETWGRIGSHSSRQGLSDVRPIPKRSGASTTRATFPIARVPSRAALEEGQPVVIKAGKRSRKTLRRRMGRIDLHQTPNLGRARKDYAALKAGRREPRRNPIIERSNACSSVVAATPRGGGYIRPDRAPAARGGRGGGFSVAAM